MSTKAVKSPKRRANPKTALLRRLVLAEMAKRQISKYRFIMQSQLNLQQGYRWLRGHGALYSESVLQVLEWLGCDWQTTQKGEQQ